MVMAFLVITKTRKAVPLTEHGFDLRSFLDVLE